MIKEGEGSDVPVIRTKPSVFATVLGAGFSSCKFNGVGFIFRQARVLRGEKNSYACKKLEEENGVEGRGNHFHYTNCGLTWREKQVLCPLITLDLDPHYYD